MPSHDAFRRKLQRRLLRIAVERRRAHAGRPSGQDIKVIARCEMLAASSTELDQRLCDQIAAMLSDPAGERRFAELWDTLPDALGTTLWPDSADDLVTRLLREAGPPTAPSRHTSFATHTSVRMVPQRPEASLPASATDATREVKGVLAMVALGLAFWSMMAEPGIRHQNSPSA